MSGYLLKGGRVVDPSSGVDAVGDLLIADRVIAEIGDSIDPGSIEVIDVSGLVVAPGLVDMHTHVREPGREDEETIASAARAAAAGGYTAICTMPNTDPVADTASVVEKVWALGREAGLVQVVPAGALSKGLVGESMADIGEMARSVARVRLFTDDGKGVQSALFARRAMEYLIAFDGIYAEHCEDESLALGGQMHEGERSIALGMRGIPAEAEELMAARDVALSRLTGCRLHLLHISTAGTVELVRRAKSEGVPVTCEATPHHFTLTDEALEGYDPNAKVNPPLRSEDHRDAVIAGLADGTIDAIATDHAPHAIEEKDIEFQYAPPGLVGLETSLALTLTELFHKGHLSLSDAIERLSCAPARILGLPDHGTLAVGGPANVVVFDPDASWEVDPHLFHSLSRNTPFGGRKVTGRVVHTFFNGNPTTRDSELVGVSV
ncbi:MAG: amidohydrolase family protein [Actinobacteria bacterium]|nr:amidohydrolase family protein [Actinomycetota bacterium]